MSSPKAVQELGREHDRKAVGTGPWKLVSFADGEKVVATRNEKYWKPGLPHLDGIEMAIIPEVATGLRSVMAGENHYVYQLQAQQRPLVERNKNLTVAAGPTVYCALLYFNCARPPFNDVRVRKAVNHTLNREDFVKLTMGGAAEPAAMLLPTTHWAYDDGDGKALSARYRQGQGPARRSRPQGRPGHQHGRLHRSERRSGARRC